MLSVTTWMAAALVDLAGQENRVRKNVSLASTAPTAAWTAHASTTAPATGSRAAASAPRGSTGAPVSTGAPPGFMG